MSEFEKRKINWDDPDNDRDRHRTRYMEQLNTVANIDSTQLPTYESKIASWRRNAMGDQIIGTDTFTRTFTPRETERLQDIAIERRVNNYMDTGGDMRVARAILMASRRGLRR